MVWTVESESLTEKKMERVLLIGSNPVFILFIYLFSKMEFIHFVVLNLL